MKKLILLLFLFICWNTFSQKTKKQYFVIDKNDALIKKQIATKANQYEGYLIINEKKKVKKTIRASHLSGDDIVYDAFEELSFAFNRNNDTIVNKLYFNKLKTIKNRRDFLDLNKSFNEKNMEYIFIEPINCKKYILRKVRPVIFE